MWGALLGVGLVLLGVVLDRLWLWMRAEHASYPLFNIEDVEDQAMRDIAARTRRAEQQMRRVTFPRWPQ